MKDSDPILKQAQAWLVEQGFFPGFPFALDRLVRHVRAEALREALLWTQHIGCSCKFIKGTRIASLRCPIDALAAEVTLPDDGKNTLSFSDTGDEKFHGPEDIDPDEEGDDDVGRRFVHAPDSANTDDAPF